MIRTNKDAFRQIGDRRIPFKTKLMLILCVFSGSDVGSKWWLLYSLLHKSNNKTPQSLNRRQLVFPYTKVDTSSPLTQGGSKVRQPCQSTIVGAVCTELCHSDRNLRTDWFEKWDFKIGIYIIIGWMCTHTSNTHLCSNNLKSEFGIRWPL